MSDSESYYSDDDGSWSDYSGSEDEDGDAAKFERSMFKTIWQIVAAISIIFACIAIFTSGFNMMVIIMAVINMMCSILVFYTEGVLESIDSLRTIMNQIREDVNELSEENDVLVDNNDKLEDALDPLKSVQKKLKKIAKKNGTQVNKLQELVRDNQRCMYETHILMKLDIKQTLMGVIFDADQNEDGVFSDKELRRLKTRLKNMPAVVLNEKIFDKKLKHNRRINAVLDLVLLIQDKTVKDKKKPLTIDEENYEIPDDDDSY